RETIVAAEAEIVAKKAEHKREGERLRDDGEIDAAHAAAEGEPAEHEGQEPGHEHDHNGGVGEVLKAIPVNRQFRPVQKDHEIRQDRVRIDATAGDVAHEIHAP